MRVVSSRRGDPRWSGGVLKRKIDYFFCEFSKISQVPKIPPPCRVARGLWLGGLRPVVRARFCPASL